MTLVLHVACTDASLNQAGRRLEVASRLTIGRGPDNDLVLDDPNRHLSKNHCVIDFDGREYRITIVGHTEGSDVAYFELSA